MNTEFSGSEMHNFAKEIWPYNRSLTGEGVLKTLDRIKLEVPSLEITKHKSGKKVYDWKIPNEWNVNYAYIIDPNGVKICDFFDNNLHLVGYSASFEKDLALEELLPFLHTLPDQPSAIPYVTSYYETRWGFCLSHNQLSELKDGVYKVRISTSIKPGDLLIGEIYIPGKSKKEVFFSTYTCHPSMGNNEISGVTVSTYLAKYFLNIKNLNYSYRFVFLPETIGSLTYIQSNLKKMKKNIVAGFNLTCIGDDRSYSFLPSRNGDTLSDKAASHVLNKCFPGHKRYSWLDRGSDERQYCAPGVDLPIASLMRTKYGEYPEYHTSLDDLTNVVTPKGLEGGFNLVRKVAQAIEWNIVPKTNFLGEPMLSKRNLYPSLSTKLPQKGIKFRMDIISYSDGQNSLIDIANLLDRSIEEVYTEAKVLQELRIITFQ
jgi:aminopeptidase-like protein